MVLADEVVWQDLHILRGEVEDAHVTYWLRSEQGEAQASSKHTSRWYITAHVTITPAVARSVPVDSEVSCILTRHIFSS